MLKHRWPKSIHCQVEAILHGIRAFGQTKEHNPYGIRSLGAYKVYKRENHIFATYLSAQGCSDLREVARVQELMATYLAERLKRYAAKRRSLQTFETALAALSKFEYGFNAYVRQYLPDLALLDTAAIRRQMSKYAKKILPYSSRSFLNRAYTDPEGLIAALDNETHRLQAKLQYESGMRTEGVGAPSNGLKNPIKAKQLLGIVPDPVAGVPVGRVEVKEKGGKETIHYVSVPTYEALQAYLDRYGQLCSNYSDYEQAVNTAAKLTNQYVCGKGSHGLKHSFSQERYDTCLAFGYSHEAAMQQVSLETAHFRLTETKTYIRNR
jgi:integrase